MPHPAMLLCRILSALSVLALFTVGPGSRADAVALSEPERNALAGVFDIVAR